LSQLIDDVQRHLPICQIGNSSQVPEVIELIAKIITSQLKNNPENWNAMQGNRRQEE